MGKEEEYDTFAVLQALGLQHEAWALGRCLGRGPDSRQSERVLAVGERGITGCIPEELRGGEGGACIEHLF